MGVCPQTCSDQSNKGFTATQIEAQKWFASGQIDLARRNFTDALTAFQNAKSFMKESAYPDYGIGETYLANKQPNDAIRHYQAAVVIQPTFALAHGRMGDIYSALNKHKEAAASYVSAVENGHNHHQFGTSLAKELIRNKAWSEASVQLEIVIKRCTGQRRVY